MIPILADELASINVALNLLGFYAEINSKDKSVLDIHDMSGNFYKKVPTHFFIEFKFEDKNGNLLEYVINSDMHTIIYGDTKIELIQHSKARVCISIEIIKDYEDDDTTKSFSISYDSISAAIDSSASSRYVSYTTNRLERYLLLMCESDSINGSHDLVVGTFGINSDSSILKRKEYDKLVKKIKPMVAAENIITHSRNKELLEYLMSIFDKEFYGFKETVNKISPLYKSIMEKDYTGGELITALIDDTINPKCDLPPIGEQKKHINL